MVEKGIPEMDDPPEPGSLCLGKEFRDLFALPSCRTKRGSVMIRLSRA
jgi:hypothetical protein